MFLFGHRSGGGLPGGSPAAVGRPRFAAASLGGPASGAVD